ncbi:transcriptional regulator [Francisella endosymbiont of Ornithodoros moubata]|nr:transcriptional regulator [Francisella endosymbiont of Ornithodoros moubata]
MSENNNQNQQETFFEFPCQFPIKIIANPHKETVEFILSVFEKYISNHNEIDFNTKESKTGKYISITAIFTADSKEQLDNIYKEISAHPEVHMVL